MHHLTKAFIGLNVVIIGSVIIGTSFTGAAARYLTSRFKQHANVQIPEQQQQQQQKQQQQQQQQLLLLLLLQLLPAAGGGSARTAALGEFGKEDSGVR